MGDTVKKSIELGGSTPRNFDNLQIPSFKSSQIPTHRLNFSKPPKNPQFSMTNREQKKTLKYLVPQTGKACYQMRNGLQSTKTIDTRQS